jgi:toxin YoeB
MSPVKPLLDVESTLQADQDFVYWQKSGNLKKLERINKLIDSCRQNPGSGIGKPERLRFYQIETYSRRIDSTHRLVYRIEVGRIIILSARFHYADK